MTSVEARLSFASGVYRIKKSLEEVQRVLAIEAVIALQVINIQDRQALEVSSSCFLSENGLASASASDICSSAHLPIPL